MSKGSGSVESSLALDSCLLPIKWDTGAGLAFSKVVDDFMWLSDESILHFMIMYIFSRLFSVYDRFCEEYGI